MASPLLAPISKRYNEFCLKGRLSPGFLLYWYRKLYRANQFGRILLNYPEFRRRKQYASRLANPMLLHAEDLQENGYARVRFEEPLLDEVLAAADARFQKLDMDQPATSKDFFYQLLQAEDFELDSPFMRLALDERILNTVADYLGMAPFLENISLLASKPRATAPTSSQQWHRDDTDRAILKVFLYINDVTADEGPLTVIPLPESRHVPQHMPHYLTDNQIHHIVSPESMVPLTGQRGTLYLVDTNNCFHFGSRCIRPRLAFVAYYTTGFGYFSRMVNHTRKYAHLKNRLSPVQQLALNL